MGAIYLLRHGQASFGSNNYDQLSPVGHQQAKVLGQALKSRGVQPDVLVSGTMQRHLETASGALSELGLDAGKLHQHSGVNEFDHENVIEVAEPRYVDKLVMMGDMAASGDPRRAFQKFFQDAQAFTINWTLANVGITKVQAGRDGLHLISVNEHAHVEGAQPSLLTYR